MDKLSPAQELLTSSGVTGFRTERGSLYSYDPEGRVQRYKTAT